MPIANLKQFLIITLHKNNINKNGKKFKNEQRNRDDAAKKELIQVE